MIYCREALKLQAFLDMADDEDILEGYVDAERSHRHCKKNLAYAFF